MLLEKELMRAGLTRKEAAVYLASLGLGPSPVQAIARKAGVARATTYVIIKSLVDRGLMTRYAESKKTMFVAEPPRQLLQFLEKQKETIHQQFQRMNHMLPQLEALTKSADDRPLVRYYKGVEGLKTIRQEMLMHSNPGDVWYNFTPVDELLRIFGEDELAYRQQRKAKGIKGKTVFTTRSKRIKENLLSRAESDYNVRKYLPPHLYTSTSGLTIFRDRIAIASLAGKVGGVIIESASMACLGRDIFSVVWKYVDKKQ